VTRAQANLLRAFAVWTLYVWVTRLYNIFKDDHDAAFKAVHTVLAVISVAFAVACWIVVRRVRAKQAATAIDRERQPVG
jgi:Na+/melibiose symporter-like transporter